MPEEQCLVFDYLNQGIALAATFAKDMGQRLRLRSSNIFIIIVFYKCFQLKQASLECV